MTIEPKYGHIIRSTRKVHNFTQEELAQKAGIAVNSLRRYESDLRCPSIDVLEKIASALGLELSEFLFPANLNEISSSLRDWLDDFAQKLNIIGYSIGYDDKDSFLWINYPDGSKQEVSEDDLQSLHSASNAFLRFQLEELKDSKKS